MSGPTGLPPARDYCPHCRIAGPHDPHRPRCPRCNGPLTPLDAYGRVAHLSAPAPAPGQTMTQAERNHTYVPPRHTSAPAARPARPIPSRHKHVRWVAMRPAEARPAPRTNRSTGPSPTPRYDHNPGWGLIDTPIPDPAPTEQNVVEKMTARLPRLLTTAAGVFVAAAAAQTWLYAVLVINLNEPVSRAMAIAARTAVIATGLAALGLMLACLVGVAGWLIDERRLAYARHGQRDPRTPEQIMMGCWIPILNLLKPLAFFRELLDRRDDLLPDYTRKRLWWLWSGWLFVNALVFTGIGIRIFADTLVWQSNALVLVIVSNLCSAAFAMALWWTITRLLAREAPAAAPRRFLAAV